MMGYNGYGYGYGDMMGAGWAGGLLMLLFAALVLVCFVLLVVWVVRASTGHVGGSWATPSPGATGHHEAVAIAKRRLASGEITAEQYDDIMRKLGG